MIDNNNKIPAILDRPPCTSIPEGPRVFNDIPSSKECHDPKLLIEYSIRSEDGNSPSVSNNKTGTPRELPSKPALVPDRPEFGIIKKSDGKAQDEYESESEKEYDSEDDVERRHLHITGECFPDIFVKTLNKDPGALGLLKVKNRDGLYPTCLLFKKEKQRGRSFGLKKGESLSAKYPKDMVSDKKKFAYEAMTAKRILENKYNKILIDVVVTALLPSIRKMRGEVFERYKEQVDNDIESGCFPTVISGIFDYSSKEKLCSTLQYLIDANLTEQRTVCLLAIIWRLVSYLGLGKNSIDFRKHCKMIYKEFNTIGRQHNIKEGWTAKISKVSKMRSNNSLGVARIESCLLIHLNPLKELREYYRAISVDSQVPLSALYLKNHSLDMPYLSGTSGMCNNFFNVYRVLGIDFNSITGIRLAEIMSAFLVAIGFHTFKECKDAFEITAEYLDKPDQVMDDYKKGIGWFTPCPTGNNRRIAWNTRYAVRRYKNVAR